MKFLMSCNLVNWLWVEACWCVTRHWRWEDLEFTKWTSPTPQRFWMRSSWASPCHICSWMPRTPVTEFHVPSWLIVMIKSQHDHQTSSPTINVFTLITHVYSLNWVFLIIIIFDEFNMFIIKLHKYKTQHYIGASWREGPTGIHRDVTLFVFFFLSPLTRCYAVIMHATPRAPPGPWLFS